MKKFKSINIICLMIMILVLLLGCGSCKSIYNYNFTKFDNKDVTYQKSTETTITESFDELYIDWVRGNVVINLSSDVNTVITSDEFYIGNNGNTYYIRPYEDGYDYTKAENKELKINLALLNNLDKLVIASEGGVEINGINLFDLTIVSNGFINLNNITCNELIITEGNETVYLTNVTLEKGTFVVGKGNINMTTNSSEVDYVIEFTSAKGSFNSNMKYTKVDNKYGFGKCSKEISVVIAKGSFTLDYKND